VNSFNKYRPSKPATLAVLLAGLVVIGVIAVVVLTRVNTPQSNNSTPSTQTPSSESLTAQALDKLRAGNQKDGIAGLRAALTVANKNNDSDAIKYIEQQIDFAQSSNFTPQGAPAPATSPNYPTTLH
jgi:hypothetical protein